MQHENDFDKRIGQLLHDWEQEPRAADWEAIESRLHPARRPRIAWWSLAALALILAGAAFWRFSSPSEKTTGKKITELVQRSGEAAGQQDNAQARAEAKDNVPAFKQEASPNNDLAGEANGTNTVTPSASKVNDHNANPQGVTAHPKPNANTGHHPAGQNLNRSGIMNQNTTHIPAGAVAAQPRNKPSANSNQSSANDRLQNEPAPDRERIPASESGLLFSSRLRSQNPAEIPVRQLQRLQPPTGLAMNIGPSFAPELSQANSSIAGRPRPQWTFQVYAGGGIGSEASVFAAKNTYADQMPLYSVMNANMAYSLQNRVAEPQNFQRYFAGFLAGKRLSNRLTLKAGLGASFILWQEIEEYYQNIYSLGNNSMRASNNLATYNNNYRLYQLEIPVELEIELLNKNWGSLFLSPAVHNRFLLHMQQQELVYFSGNLLNKPALKNISGDARQYQPQVAIGLGVQPAFAPGWQLVPMASRPLNGVYNHKNNPAFMEFTIQLRKTLK